MGKLYIYLVRRDKKEVKILAVFNGHSDCHGTRIKDIKSLNLEQSMETKLADAIYEHRMHWEPWIEGAISYQELKESIQNRGIKNIPLYGKPFLNFEITKILKEVPTETDIPISVAPKTMLRKTTNA